MKNYVIYTDSGCDIKPELLKEWGVQCRSLTFRFTDEETEYSNNDMDIKTFYDRMRAGGVAKTAAVNAETFREAFEKELKAGNDVLYLGFSSGLSTTYNSARIAAEQLSADYPDAKIVTIDTLAASAGQGLIVFYAVEKKKSGATLEETADYCRSLIPRLCHWFTVDDLVYLKRGGRVSSTAAFVGNLLGIKPVLHVDNEGHLVPVSKVRGRKTSLSAMIEKYEVLAEDPKNGVIFISHADCLSEVEGMAKTFADKFGNEVKIITDVGTVIGAHSGPGTVALFFLGKER